MLSIHHFGLFVASGLLLNLLPGQDTVYILGRSISQGRSAGMISALGISSGCLVHAFAAAFGLSAVLLASARAFAAIKFAGAAYLVYLGVRLLLQTPGAIPATASAPAALFRVYRQGILTNLLNPKVAIFFMAFLPQFVDPGRSAKTLAFLLLGFTFIFNGTLWCLLLAGFAAGFSRRFRAHPAAAVWLHRAAGTLFVGLGLRVAAARA